MRGGDWLDRQDRHHQPFQIMNALNRFADPFYCIMRLVVGLMFACHGLDKIFGVFGGKPAEGQLMVVGGWIEISCGFLVALGLITRIAAFIASGELAVVYCFVFFYIFLRGPGSFSIDAMIGRGKSAAPATP